MRDVLLMFSGGRDSFLSCCLLVEQGYRVRLVSFDNGCMRGIGNAALTAERLIAAYGDAVSAETANVSGLWRELKLEYLNLEPSEVIRRWGELSTSQFNCLSCRAAMYIMALQMCRTRQISDLAVGTRWSQMFGVEQPGPVQAFREIAAARSVRLHLPVADLVDDWTRKSLLLQRGFTPKTLEPQCLIGAPLPRSGLESSAVAAVEKCLREHLRPKMEAILGQENLLISTALEP